MKTKQSEQKIFTVVWESSNDGGIFFSVYPCDSLEVAVAKVKACKENVLTSGHFAYANTDRCTIEKNDKHYFIKDNCDDYYEDIYIKESKLFVKSE